MRLIDILSTVLETQGPASELRGAAKPVLDNPDFIKWFSGSKVVDKRGKPRLVYHGSDTQFSKFDVTQMQDDAEQGIFFTTDPAAARRYGRIFYAAFIKVTHPKEMTWQEWVDDDSRIEFVPRLKREGFDGVHLARAGVKWWEETWLVFDDDQIWLVGRQEMHRN